LAAQRLVQLVVVAPLLALAVTALSYALVGPVEPITLAAMSESLPRLPHAPAQAVSVVTPDQSLLCVAGLASMLALAAGIVVRNGLDSES
jgi:hypothetical protein